MKVAVIGAGSWGTALSQLLGSSGHEVMLWARKPEVAEYINTEHANPRYLSEVRLSDSVRSSSSLDEVISEAQAAVIVTPSKTIRETARSLAAIAPANLPVVICSKGVEEETGQLPVEEFAEEMGSPERLAVLSGPNHAEEVVRGVFSATVAASISEDTARFFQTLFSGENFRVYAGDDPCGVELCAAFKNVIAIAVGLAYGIGYGDNTAAALMTRGLAEMGRLVEACGGTRFTCMGLAGAGDLIATCTSEHSRNRRLGALIAEGKTLDDFTAMTHMVAEGALACLTLQTLADRHDVELPITSVVRSVVWEGADAREAGRLLADRPLKTEF